MFKQSFLPGFPDGAHKIGDVHFNDIDGLIEYGAESLPGTTLVVNPAWRELDKAVKKARYNERKLQADLVKEALGEGGEIQKKAEEVEALESIQAELETLRAKRRKTPKKVTIESLPEVLDQPNWRR